MSATTSDSAGADIRRLHPAWIIYSALQTLRALIIPIAIMIFSGNRDTFELFGIGLTLLITVAVVGVRALIWQRFTYQVTEQGISVHSGLISRQDRFLPAERIQAVDFNEGILHRLLGVVAVRIESAAGAGNGADITLDALSRSEAERIRQRLLGRRAEIATEPTEQPVTMAATVTEGDVRARLSFSTLLIAGATSGRIAPALGLLFGALQFVDDLLPARTEQIVTDAVPDPTLQGIASIVAVCAVFAWLFAIVSTVLTFGNFELRFVDNRLQATYGLLERRRVSIPLARIQAITIAEGLLRQPFGFAAIRAESAGYGKDTAESGVLMPIIRRREISGFLERNVPGYAVDLDALSLHGPPTRALRRYVMSPVWGVLVLTILFIAAAIANDQFDVVDAGIAWQWGLLSLPFLVVAALIGWLRFRDAGWLVRQDGKVVIRARPFHRVTTITLVRRIQNRTLTENPLQRRARLVSFSAAVASGGGGGEMGIAHLDRDDGVHLFRLLGRPAPRAGSVSA
jgi:putative membrane protein